ncbi:hypothetical protein CAter10_4073 [Collimonas arenae]|nr:hypothetical protein CAter10_4073 [Collimonas arenae]
MLNVKNLNKAAALMMVVGVFATAATSSYADTTWQKIILAGSR